MKRYKMAAVWTNDGGQLLEHDEGDWVRYEDVQERLRVLERLVQLHRNTGNAEYEKQVREALADPAWVCLEGMNGFYKPEKEKKE